MLLALSIAAIFIFANKSALNLLVADLSMAPIGVFFLVLAVGICRLPPPGPELYLRMRRKAAPYILVALGAISVLVAMIDVIGDFVMQRADVNGVVTRKYVVRGRRMSDKYYVEINGRRFPTTADIYDWIDPQSRIHAEVGRGSGNIFQAAKLNETFRTDKRMWPAPGAPYVAPGSSFN